MRSDAHNKEDLITAAVVSFCFYALILYMALFEPSTQTMWDKALGPAPYGVQQRLFIFLWITVICLPLPFGFYHVAKAVRLMKREVSRMQLKEHIANYVIPFRSVINYIRRLLSNAGVSADLKRSKLITLALIVYLMVIAIGWILWAESKGI